MGGEWKKYRLGDVADWSSGGTPSKSNEDFWGGTIPWISASSMNGNRYFDSKLKITDIGLKYGSRLAPKDSLLLLVRGSILHQKIQIGIAERDVAFNQDVKALKVKQDLLEPWYLLFWFMSKKKELLGLVENTGIGAGKLDTKILQNLVIDTPPYQERKQILSFVKALDDKIELNRQMNATLESMAQALFKSWFVDFDPVIDNALAAGSPIPETLHAKAETRKALGDKRKPLPEAIQKQFPNRFVFSEEMGWIPEGWEIERVEDIASAIGMGPFGSNIKVETFVDSGVPIINGQHLAETLLSFGKYKYITEQHASKLHKSLVHSGDIVFTHRGTIGQVSMVPESGEYGKFIVSQSQMYLSPDLKKVPSSFLIYYFRSHVGQYKLLSNSSQVGVPSIARPSTHLKSIELLVPTRDCLSEFDELCRGWLKSIMAYRSQIKNLESVRDTLLPKLLSGQLRIPDAEKLVADAL